MVEKLQFSNSNIKNKLKTDMELQSSKYNKVQVAIIADSRGMGLQHKMDICNDGNYDITVIVKRGRGITNAVMESSKKLISIAPDLIIITAGICDVTHKNRYTKRVSLQDDNIENMVKQMETNMDTVKQHLMMNLTKRPYKLVFCHITGMDMARYNKEPVEHIQQQRLNDIIIAINLTITTFNTHNDVLTPWLAKDVHMNKSKKKGTKTYRYHKLASDGLHLTDTLRQKWAEILLTAIKKLSDGSRPAQFTTRPITSLSPSNRS